MRRISTHIRLSLAVLAVLCVAGQSLSTTATWAAGSVSLSSSEKAELDKEVQEQLAKDKTGQSTGSQGATGAGSTGAGLGGSSSSNLAQKAEAEAETEEPTTKTTATTSTESSGISTGVLIPIFIAGVLLLGGIAFLIVRDARSVAPVADGLGASAQDRATRQRKRRAKAKAARQQRKRNR